MIKEGGPDVSTGTELSFVRSRQLFNEKRRINKLRSSSRINP